MASHSIRLPPLPPPPAEYTILSASPYSSSSVLNLSALHNRWSQPADFDNEWAESFTYDRYNFKGGGVHSQRVVERIQSSEDEGKEGRAREMVSHLRVETQAGEAIPEMVFDIKHWILTKLELKYKAGVLVVKNRGEPEVVVLESMPFVSRWACHLLYHGVFKSKRLRNSIGVEELFRRWSEREGRKYDSTKNVFHRILSYIRAYHIQTHQLLQKDLSSYKTLNEFFYRRLESNARPIAEPRNPFILSSAADCRLTVFRSVCSAEKLWIKGRDFKLKQLLGSEELASQFENGSVAIFRLAPSDYHRYHSPLDAVVGGTKHVDGAYYTVNSLIVQDERFNPLGENKRDVTLLHHTRNDGSVLPIAFVQVGALLVSSIRQTVGKGAEVKRGDELGYFAYGGSTIVCVFPRDTVKWDEDLLANSEGRNILRQPIETMVKAGERIGRLRK